MRRPRSTRRSSLASGSAAPTSTTRAERRRDLGLGAGLDSPTSALSGGQAARASLAAILLSRFDVLLLDEPTNDLDFDGLARLERFVAERPGGAVIVSHDRAFLERTVTRVLELDEIAHTAAEYGGGWAGYRSLARDRRAPRRGALRVATHAARPADRPRPQPAPVVGDRRAPGEGLRCDEPDKTSAPRAERSEKQAAKVRADREGDRAARRGRQAVAALGAAAALRRRRALRATSTVRAGPAPSLRARQRSARPARPRAGVGRAGRARRAERQREDDAASTRSLGRLPLAAGTRWIGPGVRRRRRSTRRAAGFDGAGPLLDAFVAQSGCRSRRRARCWPSSASGRRRRAARAQPLARRAHAREPRAADGRRARTGSCSTSRRTTSTCRRSSSSRPRSTPSTGTLAARHPRPPASSRPSTRRERSTWRLPDGRPGEAGFPQASGYTRPLMAVPRKKTSKARRDKRRAQHRLEAPRVSLCPNCRQPKQAHRVCPNCKTYRGREVEPLRSEAP